MSAVGPAMASCAPYRVTVSIFEKPGLISRRSDPFRSTSDTTFASATAIRPVSTETETIAPEKRWTIRWRLPSTRRRRALVTAPLLESVQAAETREVTVAGEAAGLRPVVVAVVVALELGERHRLGASGDRGQHLHVV